MIVLDLSQEQLAAVSSNSMNTTTSNSILSDIIEATGIPPEEETGATVGKADTMPEAIESQFTSVQAVKMDVSENSPSSEQLSSKEETIDSSRGNVINLKDNEQSHNQLMRDNGKYVTITYYITCVI